MSLKAIKEALEESIATIRTWHGMNMPTRAEAHAWELYGQSPEMKRIRAALSALEEIERGAERAWWCGLTRGGRARDVETFAKCTGHDYAEHGCGWRLVIPSPIARIIARAREAKP